MGLFSKKKKPFDEQDFILELNKEDEIYQESVRNAEKNRQFRPDTLTADEIVGQKPAENHTTVHADPFEALKAKILSDKNVKEPDDEDVGSTTPSFIINTDVLDDLPDTRIQPENSSTKKNEPTDLNLPDSDKDNELFTTVEADSTVPEIIMFSPPAEEKPEESQPDSIPAQGNVSVLQQCMPYITDEDGNIEEPKPSYELDSVAKILGLDTDDKVLSPLADLGKPKKEELPDTPGGTIIFEKISNEEKKLVISDIDTTGSMDDDVLSLPTDNTHTMPVMLFPETAVEVAAKNTVSNLFDRKPSKEDEPPDEDNDFKPKTEFNDKREAKTLRLSLLRTRKNRFIGLLICAISLIVLFFVGIPAFSGGVLSNSPIFSALLFMCFGATVAANWRVMLSFGSLFGRRTSADCMVAFGTLASIFASVLCLINEKGSNLIYQIILLGTVPLFFRGFFAFQKSSILFRNFCKIAGKGDCMGITLIDDAPTTFAMAHRAIDGDVLVATARKTSLIKHFMRNSTGDRDLSGNARVYFICGALACFVTFGAVGLYHSDFTSGAVAFAMMAALCNPLITTGCATVPLHFAAKHLDRYHSMLTGIGAAKKIEEANALAVDCDTLFPKGTVRLHSMKILSETEIDRMIAAATSITEQAGSPLGPVFRSIAETNHDMEIPEADSIKYEEGIGITGWVGNQRILIGGRTMMNAHEIEIPDSETDKQILRDGCFPTYLACDGKACALLALRYIPNKHIKKELQRITSLGVTVLVKNCDQNLSEAMLCDYFDLYEDSLRLMGGSGVHMYELAVTPKPRLTAGAATHGSLAGLAATVFCANRVKKAHLILNIAFVLSLVIGVVLFAYRFFGTAELFISGFSVMLFEVICFAVSIIASLFSKP